MGFFFVYFPKKKKQKERINVWPKQRLNPDDTENTNFNIMIQFPVRSTYRIHKKKECVKQNV